MQVDPAKNILQVVGGHVSISMLHVRQPDPRRIPKAKLNRDPLSSIDKVAVTKMPPVFALSAGRPGTFILQVVGGQIHFFTSAQTNPTLSLSLTISVTPTL